MTDEAAEDDLEFAPEVEVMLHDGSCWVLEPSYLADDADVEGVIALQYTVEAGLWYLDGATRQWIKVGGKSSKPTTLTRVQ